MRELLEKLAVKSPLRKEGDHYVMRVRDDEFIHFTPSKHALGIIKSKKLLKDPPYEKFGPDLVYAISLTFGSAFAGVQTTHLPADSGEIVALRFKTNTVPKIGFSEEVSWDKDVALKNVLLVPMGVAMSMLKMTPYRLENDQKYVKYL